jgi:hypothetical protein
VNARYRIAGIAVLLVLLLGSCGIYDISGRWSSPSPEAIADDPGAYDGQQVMLFAIVEAIDEESGTVTITAEGRRIEIREARQRTLQRVEPGAAIQVHGRLGEDATVLQADRIVVDYRTTRERQLTWLLSIAGALVAVGAFLWHWRIDWRGLRFERRGEH